MKKNIEDIKRFDMKKKPVKCRWFLKPVAWGICLPNILRHKTKITKVNMRGIKPPYLLLGNHNAFFDMNVSAKATFPHFANYIVAIDGYIGREWLLRQIGCICKRKFTDDVNLVKHIMSVMKEGGIVALYPEARYSLCGTSAPLPESLGKLCKMLKVPVVTIMCHGHHINHPFWNTRHERGVKPTEATMECLLSPSELEKMSVDEINDKLVEAFKYDDFKWQYDNKIAVVNKDRAVGLEKILYQCPCCGTEYKMSSEGIFLKCNSCGKTWEMSEYGRLKATSGETEFEHIPTWYEWERENVKKEVAEGRYSTGEFPVTVQSLPNAKGYIKLGSGTMIHDANGFRVSVTDRHGKVHTMEKSVPSMYSVHVEYEYLFKHGDCVDLNTLQDTWYTYPHDCEFSVTKMALATEELYYDYRRKAGKPCRPGLA